LSDVFLSFQQGGGSELAAAGDRDWKALLRASHLCAELDEAELASLEAVVVRRGLKKGEYLFFEGDPAEGFFILLRGGIRVYKASPDGREVTLHLIGPGQIFAEAAIFSGRGYPANACALEDSLVGFLPKERFLALLADSPKISLKMIAGLAGYVREFNRMVEDLGLKEVPARLASYLLREGERQGARVITLPSRKAELARRLGTAGETLSRAFKRLSELGCLRVEGKKIAILDAGRLHRVASGEEKA
jgi:CRP-like cAMP-binding protein